MLLSAQLMQSTGDNWNVQGAIQKGVGYFGRKEGVTTVSISVRNFIGRISFEGTIENSPEDADQNNGWFKIDIQGNEWLEYPSVLDKSKNPADTYLGLRTTRTVCLDLLGNFTYIRAVLDRDYLIDSKLVPITNADLSAVGGVELILMNF